MPPESICKRDTRMEDQPMSDTLRKLAAEWTKKSYVGWMSVDAANAMRACAAQLLAALDAPQAGETRAEVNFAFYERLRETRQYREAEEEASVARMSATAVKADPAKAARKIERLRELLAWFTLRYSQEQLLAARGADASPASVQTMTVGSSDEDAADLRDALVMQRKFDQERASVRPASNTPHDALIAEVREMSVRFRRTGDAYPCYGHNQYRQDADRLKAFADALEALAENYRWQIGGRDAAIRRKEQEAKRAEAAEAKLATLEQEIAEAHATIDKAGIARAEEVCGFGEQEISLLGRIDDLVASHVSDQDKEQAIKFAQVAIKPGDESPYWRLARTLLKLRTNTP
jgi:hypothetical protein